MPLLVEPRHSTSWLFLFGGTILERVTHREHLYMLVLKVLIRNAWDKYPVSEPSSLGIPTLSGVEGTWDQKAADHAPSFSSFWKYTLQTYFWGKKKMETK